MRSPELIPHTVDFSEPIGIALQKLQIALVDALMKIFARLFHAVVFVGAVLARKRAPRRDIQKQRYVGHIIAEGVFVDLFQKTDRQPPSVALIGERREDIPIADSHFPALESGLRGVFEMLYARGGV